MPVQSPPWTEFLSCPICYNVFDETHHRPISLGCGHTVCKACLTNLHQKKCPFDQTAITHHVDDLPVNFALLQLVGVAIPDSCDAESDSLVDNIHYKLAKKCIEELAVYLKPVTVGKGATSTAVQLLSRPMQRKLVTLVNCQLVEEEGRARAVRSARSLGERTVTELILQHQNSQQLSAHLWAAVRARGCQFLGPAMQEEVLKLILLALEDGSALTRKVLVLFVLQRLEAQYPQASKTAIGHVVQLLYRASCFKVTKRNEESSLMQLKEEFRTYESMRREHDAQIVQVAMESGLRISPDQWSSLLYGDSSHKSHMQSIMDKLQSPESFGQSVNELLIALQRSGDPGNLSRLRPHLELLANVDPSTELAPPSWENLEGVMKAAKAVVQGLVDYTQVPSQRLPDQSSSTLHHCVKYKTSMCRDLTQRGNCPRGGSCTFAHSPEEMDSHRSRRKNNPAKSASGMPTARGDNASRKGHVEVINSFDMEDGQGSLRPDDCIVEEVVEVEAEAPSSAEYALVSVVSAHSSMSATRPHTASQAVLKKLVTVPVMKPSTLPYSAKTCIYKQTIYTSPIPSHTGHNTTLTQNYQDQQAMPGESRSSTGVAYQKPPTAVKPAAAVQVANSKPNHSTMRNHPHPMVSTVQPYYDPAVLASTRPHSNYPAGIPVPGGLAFAGDTPGMPVNENTIHRAMLFPCNPYTNKERLVHEAQPTHDSRYYMPSNISMATRGTTPHQQLEELQQHRDELLAQINKTGNRGEAPQRKYYEYPGEAIEKSVNDSLASTLSMLSLARSEAGPADTFNQDSASLMSRCDGVTSSGLPSPPVSISSWSTMDIRRLSSSEPQEEMSVESFIASLEEGSPKESTLWRTRPEQCEIRSLKEDEFVPFEHAMVSKYGPISRMARAKLKNTGPVQVTASQQKVPVPVTAVTPTQRSYPIPAQIPSRFDKNLVYQDNALRPPAVHSDHIADPYGMHVAASLPTALMQPKVMASQYVHEPHTLWMLRERIVHAPSLDAPLSTRSGAEREQIKHEINQLNHRIESLQMSEDERLARELQSIELNIQETERHIYLKSVNPNIASGSPSDAELVQRLQDMETKAVALEVQAAVSKTITQEQQDRKLAEQIVLQEAEERGLAIIRSSSVRK